MATVTLLGEELVRGDLPDVCIRCGSRRGVDFVTRAFVWRPIFSPWMLLRIIPYKKLTVQVPLCEAHGGFNWFGHRSGQWWGLRPLGIGHDRVTLGGVSEEFVAALRRHRDGRDVGRYDHDDEIMYALPADGGRAPRRIRRRREPVPVTDSSWLVPLVLLSIPLLGCGGLCLFGAVANLVLPHPPPPFPGPPPLPGQAAPGAGGEVRPEYLAALAAAPAAGLPAGAPWAALVLSGLKEPLRPLNDADWNKALQDLRADDPFRTPDAATRLAESFPAEGRRAATAQALRPLLADRWPQARAAAARALGVWGDGGDAPALIALFGQPFPNVRAGALDGLAALRDERGAAAVAQRLGEFTERERAAKALAKMGPAAEKAVLPFLANPDPQVRAQACHILKTVGGRESLAPLRDAAKDADPAAAHAAAEAIKAITDRT